MRLIKDNDILYKIWNMGQINKAPPSKLKFSPKVKYLYSELEFFIKENQTQGDVVPAKVGMMREGWNRLA